MSIAGHTNSNPTNSHTIHTNTHSDDTDAIANPIKTPTLFTLTLTLMLINANADSNPHQILSLPLTVLSSIFISERTFTKRVND